MLPISLVLLAATSLVHHAHNGELLDEYPNMLRTGYRVSGAVFLAAYGCYGLDALLHYVVAPLSAHSPAMHFTIGLEAAPARFCWV